MVDMAKLEDWLSGIPSKYTRKGYKNGIKKFEAFYEKPIDSMLKLSDEECGHIVEKFYVSLKEKGHGQNSCRSLINAPLQFLKYFGKNPKYRKALGMYKTVLSNRDHKMSVEQVQKMAQYADLRELCLLETYLLGLRVRDVSELKWKDFDRPDEETPIELTLNTLKENVTAHSFISEEFQGILSKYLATINRDNPYLLQSRQGKNLKPRQIENTFQNLAKKAGIVNHGILAWHSGRRLFLRTGTELSIPSWSLKMMCGKAIQMSDAAYLVGTDVKNAFIKLSNVLRLFPKQAATNGTTKQTLDTIMEVLRELVADKLREKGLMLKTFKEPDWHSIYERIKPEEEKEEKVIYT